MKMICDVPNEVIRSIKDGTWCGSSIVEKMIAKGIPLDDVLDKIRAEIEAKLCDVVSDYTDGYRTAIQGALAILDEYKAESEGKGCI